MTSSDQVTPPKDRLFNPSRTPTTAQSRELISEAVGLLSAAENRRRKRRKGDQVVHERALAALVCDITHRYLLEPEGWLAVELSKAALAPGRRRAPFMTEQFAILVKALAAPGVDLLELQVGDQLSFTGVRSTIRASATFRCWVDELGVGVEDFSRDPLLLGDPLEMRGEKVQRFQRGKVAFIADRLPLPSDGRVTQMRDQMNEINAWIACAPLAWIGDVLQDKVDVGQRFLRRIFNNGSLDAGGRLYGGFWQSAKSEARSNSLLIDDQPTASLDFAQSALRMAYAQVGIEPPSGDLYKVPGLESYRSETKQIINALLSSDSMPKRFPRGTRGAMPKSWKFERPFSFIARYHEPIVSLFGSSSGLHFMKQESEILIHTLLRLKSMGIVALPIHDCVLVPWSHRNTAKAVMEESFHHAFGVPGMVEMEGRDWRREMEEMEGGDTQGALQHDGDVLSPLGDHLGLPSCGGRKPALEAAQ